jgi:fatty acid desaturase
MKVMSISAGWPRFLYLIFGTFIEILIKIHQKGSGGYGTERNIKPELARIMKRDSMFVLLAQFSIMCLATLCLGGLPFSFGAPEWIEIGLGMIWSYAIVWITPLFCVTVFLNRCRIVIEHGLAQHIAHNTQDFGGPRIPTIDVVPNILERVVFAPFLFNYHCAHHLFMAVPHYQLPALHKLLQQHQHEGHHHIEGGYIGALWRAMRAD